MAGFCSEFLRLISVNQQKGPALAQLAAHEHDALEKGKKGSEAGFMQPAR